MTNREIERTQKRIEKLLSRFGVERRERLTELIMDAIENKGAVLKLPNFHIPWRLMCEDCEKKVREEYDDHLKRYKRKWLKKKRKLNKEFDKMNENDQEQKRETANQEAGE